MPDERLSDLETIFNKLVFEKENDFMGGRNLVESYASTTLTTIDIEPPGGKHTRFSTKFVYNTFEIDETTNDTGINPTRFKQVSLNNERVFAQKSIPRYISLQWTPLKIQSDFINIILPRYNIHELRAFDTEGSINSLADFSNGNYFNLILRDSTADNKLYTIVSASFELMKERQEILSTKTGEIRKDLLSLDNISALEQARTLNESITSDTTRKYFDQNIFSEEFTKKQTKINDEISGLVESIVGSFGSDQNENDFQILDNFSENKKVEHVKILRETPFKATINNKYLFTIAKNVENDDSSIFSDEFKNLSFVFEQIERDAIVQNSIQKYELGALARSITSVDAIQIGNLCLDLLGNDEGAAEGEGEDRLNSFFTNENYNASYRTVGYYIEKFYVDDFGNRKVYDPIILDNADISGFVDERVLYGATYHYKIRTLIEYLIPFNAEGGIKKFARILLKSDGSHSEVRTTENIPPDIPRDFSIVYSAKEKATHLTWARDISKQQDVTKYLIFKREIINEPYTLIGLINYTPASYPVIAPKYVLDENVVVINENYGRTSFFDKKFDPSKKTIYTIVAGDAHELYSNYSSQLDVVLDRRTNKLNIKQASPQGAPLPYPNFYVNKALFNKAIFTKDAKKMELVFNPDLIDVNIEDDNGNGIIKQGVIFSNNTSDEDDENDESYKMSIINTDLGVSRVINIKVNDNRTILK